ncbi:MAG: heavy metal-associated domain-containing protein [Deltaproteobacteria bacterium]|jgi:copper ion binding protein|nr:heavy metal-associated domain-containing protein [Deltaproteobacteria bacterium]
MKKIKMEVGGMTCEHCVARVNKFVKSVNGVTDVNTSLKENKSYITAKDDTSVEAVKSAVEEAGYKPGKYEVEEI